MIASGATELLRRACEAWNRGDLDWILDHTASEHVLYTDPLVPGIRPVYRGRAGMAEYWHDFRAAWETVSIDVDEVLELEDDTVLGLLTFHATGRESGVEVSYRYSHQAKFEGGMCAWTRNFTGWNEALEANGLANGNGSRHRNGGRRSNGSRRFR